MFIISYQFSNAHLKTFDVDTASLRYDLFIGDLRFRNNEKEVVFDDIPIFDFLICINLICKGLQLNNTAVEEFDFTESDDKLIFQRDNETLQLTDTYDNSSLNISFPEFENAVNEFQVKLLQDIARNEPVIFTHPSFIECTKLIQSV